MTPTRAQYDAVLTRSSAGVRAATGDMDDAEDRAAFLDWLENLNRQAGLVDRPDVCGLDRDEQTITAVFWADADPDRASALVRQMLIAAQRTPSVHVSDEQGSEGTHGPREPENTTRDPHGVLDGDTWGVLRCRRAVIVGSNDWPPPEAKPTLTIVETPDSLPMYCTATATCRNPGTFKVLESDGSWSGKATCRNHDPRSSA